MRRLAGVIGWPIAHSLSPPMQEAAFAALALDWRFDAFAVEPARLAEAVAGAGALGFVGLNVTVPHKEAVLAFCDADAEARAVGAVNTLVYSTGSEGGRRPRGLNTDLHGFRMLLAEAGVDPRGARAVLLGAGGAARAVARVLLDGGAALTVVSRSSRAIAFADRPPIAHLAWEPQPLANALAAADLLVDATTRGLDPGSRLDLAPLPAGAAVLDLAVRPSTPLVDEARARGLRAATGEAMLVHQGARALEAWCGKPAPVETMRAALAAALRARR